MIKFVNSYANSKNKLHFNLESRYTIEENGQNKLYFSRKPISSKECHYATGTCFWT